MPDFWVPQLKSLCFFFFFNFYSIFSAVKKLIGKKVGKARHLVWAVKHATHTPSNRRCSIFFCLLSLSLSLWCSLVSAKKILFSPHFVSAARRRCSPTTTHLTTATDDATIFCLLLICIIVYHYYYRIERYIITNSPKNPLIDSKIKFYSKIRFFSCNEPANIRSWHKFYKKQRSFFFWHHQVFINYYYHYYCFYIGQTFLHAVHLTHTNAHAFSQM